MLLKHIEIDNRMEVREVGSGPFQSSPGLRDREVIVKLRFSVESSDGEISFDPSPAGVVQMIEESKTLASPTVLSSEFSERRQQHIVVSLRPLVDGAPSAAQVMLPGDTRSYDMVFTAITALGELTEVPISIEVRASLT